METELLVSDAPGTLFRYGKPNSNNHVILLLHGFPGEKNSQNKDLAENLADRLNTYSFLLHYKGLGRAASGFSFVDSIEEGISTFFYLKNDLQFVKISLVGHSWGGLVALNILRLNAMQIEKAVLLSPLVQLPDSNTLKKIATEYLERPNFFRRGFKSNLTELEEIRKHMEPIQFADELEASQNQIVIIQAKNDGEVLPSITKNFAQKLKSDSIYIEVDQSHSFIENREELFDLVAKHISQPR